MDSRRSLAYSAVLLLIACGSSSSESLFNGKGGAVAGTGGANGSGGAGGLFSTGGAGPTGGAATMGGAAATGGFANGGLANGGFANGGFANGGFANGGTNTSDSGGTVVGPTPGTVLCAGAPCALQGTPGNQCCLPGPPFPQLCSPTLTGCVTGGIALFCDDATDCGPGQICCFAGAATCAYSCTSPALQLCRTTFECYGGTCKPFALYPEYSVCQ